MQTNKQLSNTAPKQMVESFNHNPPLQARTIVEKYYLGLIIKVAGIVDDIDDVAICVTIDFHDKDNIYISCNFNKPANNEISFLDKGSKISLTGRVFNVNKNIVVLDDCKLVDKNSQKEIGTPSGREIATKQSEKTQEELFKLSPEWHGFGINLKVLWKKIKTKLNHEI